MDKIKLGQTWETRGAGRVDVLSYDARMGRFMVGDANHAYAVTELGTALFNSPQGHLIRRVPRIYVAGPMSGHDDLNFPAFNAAAFALRNRGAHVENPAEINGGASEIDAWNAMSEEERTEHYAKCIRNDLTRLMTCDTICLLPGWADSRGAKLEHHVATVLGLTVVYSEEDPYPIKTEG